MDQHLVSKRIGCAHTKKCASGKVGVNFTYGGLFGAGLIRVKNGEKNEVKDDYTGIYAKES